MKTMETFASDAAVKYFMGKDEEEREGCYELELDHLPPLLEDEENVSLADILSLRDSCLSEDEVWAVCAECAVALQSIGPSHLFHTLCITPDTLAFNALGNVCFMEQLSDDPEGSFVPPEFDNTGSTFEGHVYSLGSTLSAALDFVIEPELQAELGEEARRLLDQMQEENPGDRPLLQDILALVEAKLSHTSSAAVCRKLSSIGRRVLSIESVSTFQDGPGDSWEARWQHPKTRCPFSRPGSVDSSHDPGATDTVAAAANGLSRWQGCGAWDPSVLLAECMDGNDGDAVEVLMEGFDSWSQNSSPVRRRAQQQRSGRVRGVLNRSCSVPDSNNPPSVSPTPHGDISVPVSDLSEIGAEEQHLGSGSPWTRRLRRLERGLSCESCPIADRRLNSMASGRASPANEDGAETPCGLTRTQAGGSEGEDPDGTRDSPPSCDDPELTSDGDRGSLNHSLCSLNNHMTKSMLCLNEETQDEWISLRELLTRCGRRLAVNELWALCHTCLSTLQTYIDFPAYLCLDTVYVGCEGEVLFLKPKNIGSCDAFYLAPEYQEHGIVTEKACVYSVAAILWAAAKFSLSADQKLAMPRKLKRLLLEMAKRTPIERPSIVMAKKCCRDFLSRQGTDAETAWTKLIDRVHQTLSDSADREIYSAPAVDPTYPTPTEDSTHSNSGFVPMASESRLAPVHGPVPHSYPTWEEHGLPEAFTSRATHFTPIILTQEETPKPGATIDRTVHEFTRSNGSQRTQEKDLDCNSYCDDPSLRRTVTQRAAIFSAGADSSEGTPLDPLPSRPNVSRHGPTVSPPRTSSAHLSDYTVFDKYLLCRDPVAGHLTLVPVRVTAPESVAGWRLDLPPNPNRIQEQDVHPDANEDLPIKFTAVFSNLERQESGPSPAGPRGRPLTHNTRSESAALGPPHVKSAPLPQMSPDLSPAIHPALQEVIDLLKGEFDDGCSLKSGQEDPAMGEYIFSLKDLQYQPFSSLVKKKFGDLYWEEDLVAALHGLVNYSPFPLGSNEQPPLTALKGAPGISPVRVAVWRVRSEGSRRHLRGCLDLNGNIHIANPVSRDTPERSGAQPSLEETPASNRNLEGGSEDNLNLICRDADSAGEVMATGVTEGADHSMGGSDESPSDVDSPWGRGAAGSRRHEQMSPGCSEDMDDSESVDSGRRLSPGSKAEEPDLGSGGSPAWAMAFYGEERFSTEVVGYALTLGQHMMSPRLDAKTQELQQQLIIEKRNLKKTRKFYQKLLHQEQKSKGSDTKPMLSKLKTQLEEVISKVEFLDSVKKYLEVLSVDQWGLEVSLLPSLAACGLESLALRHHPDPSAVLSFGTSRGKSALQAGSPLGLMAYLYAQNAALEGYIQQFLYTYRYFCTNEEFLQFLMDTFTSAARSPDISGNSVKILFRTLDLLQAWLTDYKLVASTPKCILLATLENFLVTEVIPVDSRGETLLSVLHRSPAKSWSRGGGGPGGVEQDDSLSVHSPTGDHGRKTFQWRISRVVEPSAFSPKEEAFCIAAMLPMPCYSSLVGNLSSVSLRGEESPPFSQSDYSAQHAAQQLTLLQQEIFQGCHPVHFLNSRTQGVRDTLWSPNMNVSQQVAPAEDGGSLQKLLAHADNVSNWIAAEIVTCASVKAQAALLTKFLQIGKYCYESRNFGTAMQVLRGLENVIVRQLPAWKHLSSKVCENLEELRAVQVFLKSDDLCLMGGEQVRRRPTLPCVHILAMHVQQLEVGGFTLTTGAYRWTKLRRIAKVVSQVHAFQEAPYPYGPDRELQAYLRHRVDHLAACDIHLVAADSDANFQPSTARHGRRIQDTLQRVKATFQ